MVGPARRVWSAQMVLPLRRARASGAWLMRRTPVAAVVPTVEHVEILALLPPRCTGGDGSRGGGVHVVATTGPARTAERMGAE